MIPVRATEGSAGYDLYPAITEEITLYPGQSYPFPTGLAIEIPSEDCAALIYARSGLATKQGIVPANCVGVVDSDYRGEIKVCLKNLSDKPYTIKPGERIAQLIFTPVIIPQLTESDELDETKRGDGGFGSTDRDRR